METRIKIRRDTAADWSSNNTVLGDGEFGYTTDTHILKLGNGVTAWNSLSTTYIIPNKEYVDLQIATLSGIAVRELVPTPTSDHDYSGDIAAMTVDVNGVGFAAALHLDTDGNWIEASASAATTVPCLALALETGTGSKKVFLKGFIRDDSWSWTVGEPIYVGVTAGTLTQTMPSATGQQVQILGYATHANRVLFNPSVTIIELT